MDDKLKEILESDYKFVLINGDYFDCPSCNPTTSFNANTFYDEKELLEHILKRAGSDRMEAIWVLDSFNGDMVKYCDIETKASFHNVSSMEFTLPEKGKVIIFKDKGGWAVAKEGYTVLYGR
jgi:hypothetical protein